MDIYIPADILQCSADPSPSMFNGALEDHEPLDLHKGVLILI